MQYKKIRDSHIFYTSLRRVTGLILNPIIVFTAKFKVLKKKVTK